VYILKDGSVSPVFNIRGATNIPVFSYDSFHYNTGDIIDENSLNYALSTIQYSEEDFMLIGGTAPNENAKGVIQFSDERYDVQTPFPVVGVDIRANYWVIEELKKYVKGFFFVRQKRIPLTMA
jgi:hypothetical protein